MDINTLASDIATIIDDKKGEDIVILDLRGRSSLTDYFVIATGRSDKHTTALAKYVEDELYDKVKLDVHHKEGHRSGDWVVLDYIDIVVHIFNDEKRKYYNLEKLWMDADRVPFEAS